MTVQTDPEGTERRLLHRYADFGGTPRKRVLEVGSGDGRLTWRYARAAAHVVGIDLHPDDLRIAVADRPTELTARVHFGRADAEHLPFEADAFDLAIFAWSF
jgi:ubiquinone/menaquinone biosynthesis C-methylase UbiE